MYTNLKHLTQVVRSYSFNSTHMSSKLLEFCTNFLWWFRSNSFAYSALWPGRPHVSIRKSLEKFLQIILIQCKQFKTWNNFGKEFVLEGVEAAYVAWTIFFIDNYLKSCVCVLLVAATLLVTSASCERSFSKVKLVKTFLRNFMTSERLGNTDLLWIERYKLKNLFRWFCWMSQSTW